MENLSFRSATENDLEAILDIYNFYIANSTALWDYEGISVQELRDRIPIGIGKYNTYIICSGIQVAGFCSLKQYRNKAAYARTAEIGLYLREEFTRKGIGKQAVLYLENLAARENIKVLIASICGENVGSLRLFQRMGYEQCAYYKEIGEKFGRTLDVVDLQKIL